MLPKSIFFKCKCKEKPYRKKNELYECIVKKSNENLQNIMI